MRKFAPENWERLIGEARRAHLPPEALLDRVEVPPGGTVADIGAGPGYFTLPLADRVGPTGRVYALDVQPEMIEILRSRNLPPQVQVTRSGESELPLEDRSIDLAFLAFVYHEAEDRPALLAEIRRVLRPTGRLFIAEWVPREEDIGPPLHERLSAETVREELDTARFAVIGHGHVTPSVYYFIAQPPGSI
jgi:ubiquinone/menaquinone biosynthesis C-methylase UbiE